MPIFGASHHPYDTGGNMMDLNAVRNRTGVIGALEKFQADVARAIDARLFDPETSIEIECDVEKVMWQSQQAKPEKQTIVAYLEHVEALIHEVGGASNLVTDLTAVEGLVEENF